MALRGEISADGENAGEASAPQQVQPTVFVLHPNCAFEDV